MTTNTFELAQQVAKMSKRGWLIWATGMSFVLFQFTLQLSSGVIIAQVARDFNLSAVHAGTLAAAYFHVYVLLQIPAGILADRFGARRILTLGSIACTIGCALFAQASSHLSAEFGRVIMGAGGALSYVGVLYVIQNWFPSTRFALMVGFTETVGLLSTVFCSITLAKLLPTLGWRSAMIAASFISFVIALLCWLIVRDKPQAAKSQPPIRLQTFIAQVMKLIKSKRIWLNGIYCGLVYTIVTTFVALWGIPFLKLKYDISLELATKINMCLFIGAGISCPLIGWIAARFRCLKPLLLVGALGPLGLMLLIIYTTPPIWFMGTLLCLAGIFMTPYFLSFAIADRLSPPSSRSTCIGITNGLCMLGAPIFQTVVGALLDLHHADKPNQLTIVGEYALSDYHFALFIFPILLGIAAWIAWRMPLADITDKSII